MKRTLAVTLLLLPACAPPGAPPDHFAAEPLRQAKDQVTYKQVAALGDPDPGAPGGHIASADNGGYFWNIEVNADGEVLFNSYDETDAGEASFTWKDGKLSSPLRPWELTSGGHQLLDWGALGTGIDDDGNVVANWFLEYGGDPYGSGVGLVRYNAEKRSVEALVVPDQTPIPGGNGTFSGLEENVSLGAHGAIVFSGLVPFQNQLFDSLSVGVFASDRKGNLSPVVVPGDAAPGGARFDQAVHGWINNSGDIAFGAHLEGEECVGAYFPGSVRCFESAYVRSHAGTITSIAHQGDPAPGGGTFRFAWGPKISDAGDVVFVGDLSTPPDFLVSSGVYLYHQGAARAIARPGDSMPGGGALVTGPDNVNAYRITRGGLIAFEAFLDDGGIGIYVHREGKTRLVARTGTVMPGIGTIADFYFPAGPDANDDGQVVFQAALEDGGVVVVLAKLAD